MYGILLIILLLILYLLKQYTSKDTVYFSGVPKPSVAQLLLHVIRNRSKFDTLKILTILKNTYGETFLIHIKPFSPVVVTSDPKYFGQILASKEHLNKTVLETAFGNVMSDCTLLAEVEIWRHDRKILNDAFGHQSHKEFLVRLEQTLHRLDDIIMERIDGPIDMQDVLHDFLLHTTVESCKDPCVRWNPQKTIAYMKSSTEYLDQTMKRMLPMLLNMEGFFKMTSSYKILQQSVKIIRQFGEDLVDAHLEAKDRQTDANNIIYRMHEAGVPHKRIVDNVLMFIQAAYETVNVTLSFAIFELAKHPDIQDKILAEIQDTVAKDRNVPISGVDVHQLKYTRSVLKETLRKYTVAPSVARKLTKAAVVGNTILPKDTNILFFIDGLHKSEKYHTTPLAFDPDRFSAENKTNMVANSWAPFGLGIRNCFGQSFAMQEMTLILASMVRKYRFCAVVPEHVLDIESCLVTKSSNGAPVVVEVR